MSNEPKIGDDERVQMLREALTEYIDLSVEMAEALAVVWTQRARRMRRDQELLASESMPVSPYRSVAASPLSEEKGAQA